MKLLSPRRPGRPSSARTATARVRTGAFTLVEVLIAAMVMTILFAGLFAMVLQSRRLTEGSIIQNSAITVLQGYIEQMKNMDFSSLLVSPAAAGTTLVVPTVLDESTADPLTLSYGSPPASLPALGTTPTGAVDNNKTIAMKNPAVDSSDTLNLNVWLWVQDLTGSAADVTNSKAITIIYTYTVRDGARVRSYRGSLRSIRSVVPSF